MTIIGIDEVGRGCWAGPLVAAAVALTAPVDGLADSKQLPAAKRQDLSELILQTANYGIGWVSATEVDQLGLTKAVSLAMTRAMQQITTEYNQIIIDGDYNFLPDYPKTTTLIKADASVPAVSAASIIAKVARDNYMVELAKQYPVYGFERHVGYGTQLHREALAKHGLCPEHRLSYKPIKALLH